MAIKFGPYELDAQNFELRRDGKRVKIEKSPLELLIVLAERAGQLVTQEEAAELVWGNEVHIETGSALYTAVKKIRQALGDARGRPKYIETVARKGYRFKANCRPAGRKAEKPEREARRMLAVLPLENLSGDAEQEYFSDGMTEELITELGTAPTEELGVIARTSVMRYKRTKKSIRQIGRELGADYLIEGSVRRAGGRVRIAVQLIRADDQTHIWAAAFEKPAKEVLQIQAEVAQAAAQEVRVRLGGRPSKAAEIDPELYDSYLRGRFLQAQLVRPALAQAIQRFERVLEQEENFAPAWVGMAECYLRLPITSDVRPNEAFPKARAAAARAIAIDGACGEAYSARSGVRFWNEWNWKEAEQDALTAQRHSPSYAEAYLHRAHVLSNLGRHDEAIPEIARAKKLDPFSRIVGTLHGQFHYQAGTRRYGEAESLLRYALQIDPQFWVAHIDLCKIWGMQGKWKKALAAAKRAFRFSHGNMEATSLAGWTLAKSSRMGEARKKLKELEAAARKRYVPPVHRALIQAGCGEKKAAVDSLEEALEERDVRLTFLLVEPRWDELRTDGRFQAIMRRLNLTAGGNA